MDVSIIDRLDDASDRMRGVAATLEIMASHPDMADFKAALELLASNAGGCAEETANAAAEIGSCGYTHDERDPSSDGEVFY